MNKRKVLMVGALGLVAISASCTELTHLGVSGEVSPIRSDDSAAAVARHYTTLSSASGHTINPFRPLGDVDGDGMDDMLLAAWGPGDEKPGEVGDMTAYLFYGRELLPEQLSYADADATFDTGILEGMAIGDVNGDGLADFALGDGTGYEIVFGSPARYSGHHAKLSSGHRLQYGGPPPEGGQLPVRFYRVLPVGDVNGDGTDEFFIQATVAADIRLKVDYREYLIEGRTGDWPSGAWDWSSAAALLEADSPSSEAPVFSASGDIDGDGYTDILARSDERYWLFYGGPDGLHGTLTPSVADAVFDVGEAMLWIGGDIDEDGRGDIQIYSAGETKVVYGSSTRYSGRVTLEADLIFTGQSCNVHVGDFNGDGLRDLIINSIPVVDGWKEGDPVPENSIYELRGTGTRLTGRKELLPAELYRPVGYAAPEAVKRTGLGPYGDIDGDGSTELVGFELSDPASSSEGAVYLLPGSTPAPD
jgi:hypothetical protein